MKKLITITLISTFLFGCVALEKNVLIGNRTVFKTNKVYKITGIGGVSTLYLSYDTGSHYRIRDSNAQYDNNVWIEKYKNTSPDGSMYLIFAVELTSQKNFIEKNEDGSHSKAYFYYFIEKTKQGKWYSHLQTISLTKSEDEKPKLNTRQQLLSIAKKLFNDGKRERDSAVKINIQMQSRLSKEYKRFLIRRTRIREDKEKTKLLKKKQIRKK